MELYFSPPEDEPSRSLTRERILAAFESKGLRPKAGLENSLWSVEFEASRVFVSFQETDGLLVFATLDQPMLDASDVPALVFETLEELGWECDESVG
jgi:hypothetical protein